MSRDFSSLRRGKSIIRVWWRDIVEDSCGDPKNAFLALRKTVGHFKSKRKVNKLPCVILSFTRDEGAEGSSQSGWICIPTSLIQKVEVIRK